MRDVLLLLSTILCDLLVKYNHIKREIATKLSHIQDHQCVTQHLGVQGLTHGGHLNCRFTIPCDIIT